MSESKTVSTSFAFPWLLMFILVKVGGSALASWSWWWIFFPIVPDLVLILRKLGLL